MQSVVTVEMEPNATYRIRHATLIRIVFSQLAPEKPFTGVLEICERNGPKSEPRYSRYAIKEVPLPDGVDRRFRLTKPGGRDWYFVLLEPNGYDRCECEGYHSHGRCKHTTALRKFFDLGHLD